MDDKEWLRLNFGMLVDKFGGRYVLVINNKVYPVDENNIVEVENRLRAKYKKSPIGLPVPRPQEFMHILRW